MTSPRVAVVPMPVADRLARAAERSLRVLGEGRTAITLLLAAGAANVAAALLPGGAAVLDGWPYALLLGVVVLSAMAGVAVRLPSAWREWRRPVAVRPGAGVLRASLLSGAGPDAVGSQLRAAGYRVRTESTGGRWAVYGVRRGWSRLAGLVSHLAVVVLVLGVAVGAAYGSEATFTLLPGDQALLDAPRAGFSSAMRLDHFAAEFDTDGRPRVLDTSVTFLRDGQRTETRVLRANEPGGFDGHLVHPWSYGPAVRMRVMTLDGSPLLDGPIALEAERDGVPVGSVAIPTVGVSLGISIASAEANQVGLSVVDGVGAVERARLAPGEETRIGPLLVRFDRFDAWVTFLSRRDPGLGLVMGGAALLAASLAVALWLPRRRVTVRSTPAGATLLLLGGEPLDRPTAELERLIERLGDAR
jgi:cytochrome c biogenesis protein ResB